jgi:hypothetical protein
MSAIEEAYAAFGCCIHFFTHAFKFGRRYQGIERHVRYLWVAAYTSLILSGEREACALPWLHTLLFPALLSDREACARPLVAS